MDLAHILLATLAGGVLSVGLAAGLSLTVLARWAPRLVGFSVGALLAAALLHLLPEALEALPAAEVGAGLLAGIALFFVLEKLALWRHDHAHPDAAAEAAPALMILIGDAVHNLVDGVLIAAAFLQDTALGVSATLAIVAHEVPQEVGDFMVLLACGYSRRRALLLNAATSLTALLGGLLGWLALNRLADVVPYVLVLACASFLYVAVADLVPALQRRRRPLDFAVQLTLLAGGVGTVWLSVH